MTQRTKTALGTQVSTLAADNTAGDISASDIRSLLTDTADSLVGGPTSATDNTLPRFDSTTGQLMQSSGIVVADTTNDVSGIGMITSEDDAGLQTTTTTTDKVTLGAYDVNGTAYLTFATLTAADVPSFDIVAPGGGTIAIDGATIGGATPGAVSATTLSATGAIAGGASSDIAINTNKFTVAAASGNTVVAGTLGVTGLATVVNATATGYIRQSVGNVLTAAGTTRADALVLADQVNNITTAAASTGAVLPAGVIGDILIIENAGANAIQVYGNGSDTIDGVAGTTGVVLTNAKRCMYICVAANTIISAQLGAVSA